MRLRPVLEDDTETEADGTTIGLHWQRYAGQWRVAAGAMGGQEGSRTKEAERRHEGEQTASEIASVEDQEMRSRRGIV
jgi:hypothetical protein